MIISSNSCFDIIEKSRERKREENLSKKCNLLDFYMIYIHLATIS